MPPHGPIAGCRPLTPKAEHSAIMAEVASPRCHSRATHRRFAKKPPPGSIMAMLAVRAITGQPVLSGSLGLLNCEQLLSWKTNTSEGNFGDGKIHRFDNHRGIFDLCRNLCTCGPKRRLAARPKPRHCVQVPNRASRSVSRIRTETRGESGRPSD